MEIKDFVLGFAAGKASGVLKSEPFKTKNYIKASGTQWIDTGYFLPSEQDNLKFEVVFEPSENPASNAGVFGTRRVSSGSESPASNALLVTENWNNNKQFGYQFGSQYANSLPTASLSGKKMCAILEKGTYTIYDEEMTEFFRTVFSSTTEAITTASVSIFSFNTNNSDGGAAQHSSMKLYRFRIYEGDDLVHEFIPWQENGVACLKDTVTGNFKYNAGTGDFVYGTDT